MSKRKGSFVENVAYNPVAHAVQRVYERSAPLLIVEAIVLVVAGVIMLWKPVDVLGVMTFVLGGVFILLGLYRTIAGFVVARGVGGGWLDVVFGLLGIGVGALFCVYPIGSMVSFVYVFVVLFLFKALRNLVFAINMTRVRFGHWGFNLIMSVILVALAMILLFYPMAWAIAVVVYLAIILLVCAAMDVYMFIKFRRLKSLVDE